MKTMTFADLYLKLHDENGIDGFDIGSLSTSVKAANQPQLTAAFKKHLELTAEQLDRTADDADKGPGRLACERVVARTGEVASPHSNDDSRNRPVLPPAAEI